MPPLTAPSSMRNAVGGLTSRISGNDATSEIGAKLSSGARRDARIYGARADH